MKKSLIALAVLGTFAGVAAAQSSVKLDGTVDLNLRSVKNGSASGGSQQKYMGQDGINSSQFRVSGTEDLGGGLKAGFNLNAGHNPDTGTTNAQFWNRRSTIQLSGGFGEIRMGRDYTPTFWNQTLYDPFGTNGVGTTTLVFGQSMLGTNAQTRVRADNSVQYWTPAMGGFELQAMISPNEGYATGTVTGNKYSGVRVGFAAGPVSIGASLGRTDVTPSAGQTDDKLKLTNLAGSYKFGPAKVNLQWAQSKTGSIKEANLQVGTNITMGQGELRAAWNKVNHSGGTVACGNVGTAVATTFNCFRDADDSTHIAVGYVYNLSTRTAFYGTYATLRNKGQSKQSIAGNAVGMIGGERSSGGEVGMRHFF